MNKDNRMLRIGLGKHESKWFFRIDLWYIGMRITGMNLKHNPYKLDVYDYIVILSTVLMIVLIANNLNP